MDTLFQRPTNRSIIITTDGFHVIVRTIAQDESLTGVLTIRLSANQARQLATRELLCFDDMAPAPQGPFVELWHTPLPDGSSHIAMSYSLTPHPDKTDMQWLGVIISAEDYPTWHAALLLSANRVE